MKTAFEILQYEPRPFREFDVQKISGSEQDYRIRIGKYRFIYSIFQEEQAIVILKIDLRSETTYK